MPADTGLIIRRLQAVAGGVPAQCRNIGNGAIGINDLFARLAVVKTRIAAAGGHIGIVRIRHMALVAAAAAVFRSHKYLTAAIGIAGAAAHRTQIIIMSVAAGLAVPVSGVQGIPRQVQSVRTAAHGAYPYRQHSCQQYHRHGHGCQLLAPYRFHFRSFLPAFFCRFWAGFACFQCLPALVTVTAADFHIIL